MNMTDEELAVQAIAGDNEAFRDLYERYFDRLYDYLVRMTGDPEESADVAQDTFLKLLPGGTDRPPQSNFRSWLYTVAKNTAIDRIRRKKRQIPIPSEGDEAEERFLYRSGIQPAEGPEEAARNQELAALVWQAARGLDPDDYSLLDLSLRQQLAPKEVAEVWGVKPSNIYTKLSRLRDRLEQSVTAVLLIRQNRKECRELDQVLARTLDAAEISPRRRRDVARHAVSCDVCSSNRQRYASASAIFGSFALVAPPLLLKERILSDLLAAFPTGAAVAATPGASAGPVASDAEASASETTGTGAVKWFLASVAAAVILGAAFVVPVVDPSGCLVLSLNPDKHYQAGLNYKQLNEWGDAAQSFTKAIACDSGRVDALVERGLAHRVLGRPEEAILDFKGALTAGATPSDFSDYYYLGFSYLHLAELGEGVHNLSLSLWAFDRAIATNSDDADSYVNRGIVRRHLAIIDPEQMALLDAIGDFDRAIKLDPTDADAFANRGIAYRYQGKREESLADIARSVEISGDPSSPYSFDQEYWKQLIEPTGGRTYQPVLPPFGPNNTPQMTK